MRKPPRHLAELTEDERAEAVVALGEKAFRARQLSVHYFERLVVDSAEMTDLPAGSKDRLVEVLLPRLLTAAQVQTCDAGATVKTAWRLFDGALVESVLMRYPDRITICASSQAGCGMGCPFCATGQAGLTRNLSAGEIVEQVGACARSVAPDRVSGSPSAASRSIAGTRPTVDTVMPRPDSPSPAGGGASRARMAVSRAP